MTNAVRVDMNCGGEFLWKEIALTIRARAGGGQYGGIVLDSTRITKSPLTNFRKHSRLHPVETTSQRCANGDDK